MQDLARLQTRQLVDEIARGQLRGRELARRHVEVRQPAGAAFGQERDQIVRRFRIELLVVDDRSRRHHAHDLALDDAFGQLRILDLLGDRDLEAEGHQARQILLGGVVRHATHRNRVLFALVAAGQRQIERARDDDRVIEEHLVEVAEPKKDHAIGMRLFDLEVLAHQRRIDGIGDGTRHGSMG